jgi:type II secretory pathway pseudopilin PulG
VRRSGHPSSGFTIVEIVIVLLILTIVTAFSVTQFSSAGQEERFIQQAARRVRERRVAAIRLNPLQAQTSLETYAQSPLVIDLLDLPSTATLTLDGPTGNPVTQFNASSSTWTYVYEGQPLVLPTGWRVASSTAELAPIPAIPGSRGVFATSFGFLGDGTPSPAPPSGSTSSEAPFWAVYFTNGLEARAVAVHATGLIEIWRYGPSTGPWRGFGGRQ